MDKAALKNGYVQKAVSWIEKKGYAEIKADLEGLEAPTALMQSSTNVPVQPDLTALSLGRKFYFEVALKSDNTREVVTKWKLLSQLAAMKDGKLIVFAPHGHRSFAEKIIENNRINAQIVSLRAN
jgi:hypothetical protein